MKADAPEHLARHVPEHLPERRPENLSARLSAWLAATDIDALELSGPGVHLRLRREAGQVRALGPAEPLGAAAAATAPLPTRTVTAPAVGIFQHAHPMHVAPLASPGSAVKAGQALGLLRIGLLLIPVPAPCDGIVIDHVCADGAVVGYGTPLVHLLPRAAKP
jgi:acetyl-CoA carboxylase biotin carboxyl carrier protein